VAQPVSDIPRASVMHDMVFAVKRPAHEPAPGQQFFSIRSRSLSVILPALYFPTASNAETRSQLSFPAFPVSIARCEHY